MRVRVTALAPLALLVVLSLGCESTTPTVAPTTPRRTLPSLSPAAASTFTPTPAASSIPTPAPSPTPTATATPVPTDSPQSEATALPQMRQAVSIDHVVQAGAASCTGEWFGGTRSVDYSHDLWTIRCPSVANVQQMQDNLRIQLEDLGMTIRDSGNNSGPNGDVAYEVNYAADGLLGTARMVVLGEGDGQVIVFTIDQTPR